MAPGNCFSCVVSCARVLLGRAAADYHCGSLVDLMVLPMAERKPLAGGACRTIIRSFNYARMIVRQAPSFGSSPPPSPAAVEPKDGQNWDPAGDDRGRFAHRTVIRGCVNRHNMSVTRRFDGLRWPSGLRTLALTCTGLSQSIQPPVGPLGDRFLVKPAPFSGTAPRPEHVR